MRDLTLILPYSKSSKHGLGLLPGLTKNVEACKAQQQRQRLRDTGLTEVQIEQLQQMPEDGRLMDTSQVVLKKLCSMPGG